MVAGDFIYFPPGWLHRVKTHDRSIGVGGYLLLEACVPESEEVCAQLKRLTNNPEDFFWPAIPNAKPAPVE